MHKLLVTLSNGDCLELEENDQLTPISSLIQDNIKSASMNEAFELYYHVRDGLIPAFMDIACNYDYFLVNDNHDVIYCTKSIIKIENI